MEKKADTKDIIDRVADIVTRGVGTFVDPEESFKKKLIAKAKGEYTKDIIIKFGVDPTRPDIHLGHAVVLRKLRQLQDLGCKIVFLIGDYTAQIGDPTGKSKTRPEVEQAVVEHNMQTYLEQVVKILNTDKNLFSWIRNSDWFTTITDIGLPKDTKVKWEYQEAGSSSSKRLELDGNSFVGKAVVFEETRMQKKLGVKQIAVVTMRSLLWMLKHVTLAQLSERDMFQDRIKRGDSLFMHEMLYPVFQGIDSDVLHQIYGSCDLEIGGTDQTFNMLMGRKIMEVSQRPPQSVLALELLVGLDGKEKMSKSLDNYVGITDAPNEMFGKLMSIPDSAIATYYELCTFTSADDIKAITKKLESGKVNPRDSKMELAEQVVAIYHGQTKAKEARAQFVDTFQNKKLPNDIPEARVKKGTLLVDVLIDEDVVDSKSEFRRLMGEGAIRKDGEEKLSDPTMKIEENTVLKVGKHRFIKIIVG